MSVHAPTLHRRSTLVSRIAVAIFGGYAFTWGVITLTITALMVGGGSYADARKVAMLFSFIVFLGAFIWGFSTRRLVIAWVVLVGGGAVMTLMAWMAQRAILA